MPWTLFLLLLAAAPYSDHTFSDHTFPSRVFGHPRHYRVFLPADYHQGSQRYPVIYYFHSHSDRYTLQYQDQGKDTIPKIARFVAAHPVIVVAMDGYVAEHYTGFYGGAPYDVQPDGGRYDFGEHFQELVDHIDRTCRTLPTRRHRATSGLSMGGYLSLWLSARYPDLIGSASAFNPGPEFYAGEPGRRVLWRPKDHVRNHAHSMVRLVRASGDYISQYHEETRLAYARAAAVDFEFRQDEYHRHWATSIGETFAFHARAFANPKLDQPPATFDHASPYARFALWGWTFETKGGGPGYTIVSNVSRAGLRVQTRRWAPDGPPVRGRTIAVTTPPAYQPGTAYALLDAPLAGGPSRRASLRVGADGRLRFSLDGDGRQVSISGPGIPAPPPVLLPLSPGDALRVAPGVETSLPIRVLNPRGETLKNLRVELASDYPTVELRSREALVTSLGPGETADLSGRFRARFTAGGGDYAPARLTVKITAAATAAADTAELLIAPDHPAPPLDFQVLDGRTVAFRVFRQKGNQGGGGSVERKVTEGRGNGNGVLEPGEEATVWVRLAQGLDPFDKGNWYRARVFSDSPWIEEIHRLEEQKQREWTGARELTSIIRLKAAAPPGTVIPALLANESWSFHFTPDVRYGAEPLYQAFQLHRGHVHRTEFRVPAR